MTIEEVLEAFKQRKRVYHNGRICEIVYAETGFGDPSVTVQPIGHIGCKPEDLSLTAS